MRLMLISLIAMSCVACASTSERTAPPNPLVGLEQGGGLKVSTTQSVGEQAVAKDEDRTIIVSGCPRQGCRNKYRYLNCELSDALSKTFVHLAAFAAPMRFGNVEGLGQSEPYYFGIQIPDHVPLDGHLHEDGLIVLGDSTKGNSGVHAYRLNATTLKSLLALLDGSSPEKRCGETTEEFMMVSLVPFEFLEQH